MKIDSNQIPPEGLILSGEFTPQELDLETDIIKFHKKVLVTADVSNIYNVLTVNLNFDTVIYTNCSRCLNEIELSLKNAIELHYPIDNLEPRIDLDPDIREEIILNYPLKPLCKPDCKGLCPKCGRNLNEGKCVH